MLFPKLISLNQVLILNVEPLATANGVLQDAMMLFLNCKSDADALFSQLVPSIKSPTG